MTSALAAFVADVGSSRPVTCVGGRTQWSLGGRPDPDAREVWAPTGVVAHEPGEMIVRVRAGTTLGELDAAVSGGGQMVALEADRPEQATVGGVLSCGLGGLRRLGWGPPRDAVLEITAVSARGDLIRAGAPLVKNVTGYDLCRLLVGSYGTLAFVAEVVLRCRPRPETEAWYRATGVDPFGVFRALYRPLAVLWDGTSTWVGLSGYRVDVVDQRERVLGAPFSPVDGPPAPGLTFRRSLAPAELRSLPSRMAGGRWLAQVGVGVVQCESAAAASLPPVPAGPGVVELHRRLKERFDPTGRLNPGRSPLSLASAPQSSVPQS